MSAPENLCACCFCGETFGPDGITNHETWCDENPHRGTPVAKQKELGIFEASEGTGDGSSVEAADPDQRVASTDGGSLPPRSQLPGDDKTSSGPRDTGNREECPRCGSDDTIPSHEARRAFKQELGTLPDGLRATLDATERYCNECWSVYGGELSDPYPVAEGAR